MGWILPTAHPRIRGEHPCPSRHCRKPIGSSPYARGTRTRSRSRIAACRFIPAYAGNADCPEATGGYVAVHPRIREERWVIRRSVISHPGSSLHTRETPPCQRDQGCFCRFIPACAGNARARFTKARSWPVHPRIRGERAVGARVVEPVAGLSPHARGTLRRQQRGSPGRRFIPAYAGNASDEEGADCCFPVHPRIRGERLREDCLLRRSHGSSPHSRGTRSLL